MKKSYIPISDVSNEKTSLQGEFIEVVRQLDEIRGRSQTISNLFLPCSATLKIKLHDLCYKLILTDPLGYGKKGEELLWRKGYHDIFTTAKRLRKSDTWSPEDAANIQGLLISGIGHYQHLLFKLQTDYKLNFQGVIDFSLNMSDAGLPKGKITSQHKVPEKHLVEWAKESCHRCLIYLGDLNRYLLDIYPLWDSGTAERYYLQAANLNINCGRPFNQLGTLAGCKNYNLDAIYNYVRCMTRPEPFQGAEGNLRKALDQNSEFMQLEPFLPNPAPSIQKLIMRFLFLFDIWYFENTIDSDLHNSCHEMLQELHICLKEENLNPSSIDYNELEISNITPFRERSLENSDRLTSDMVLKMIILVLICVDKLQKKDSSQASAVVAICLAILSQLLQHMIERFEQFYSRFGPEVFSNESQKSSSCESQPKPNHNEKYKKKSKFDNQRNGNSNKKKMKCLDKKRNKNYYKEAEKSNCGTGELSDITINDAEEGKTKVKRKCRLKRRKRTRPVSSCDSDISDSDLTLDDSSSGDETTSEDSDSEEIMSSGSEDLDETLIIIDQKIKEKKIKEEKEKENQTNGLDKANTFSENVKILDEVNSSEKVNDATNLQNVISTNGVSEQNGIKLTTEKDKTKSLFTILNGLDADVKLNENNRGDFTVDESITGSDTTNMNTLSESATNESSELGGTAKNVDSNSTLYNLRKMDSKKFLQFLSQQEILRAIKLYCDWFQTDAEVIKVCCKNSKTLLGKIVTFLNLITFEEELFLKEWSRIKEKVEIIPLSEDFITRGLPLFRKSHEKLDWDYTKTNRVSSVEENLLRLAKITEFGHCLTTVDENGILFNKLNNTFYIAGQNGKVTNTSLEMAIKKQTNNTSRKGQLMKNMGQLWLKAEVRDLESRVRRRAGNFSPYLVVDSEALIEHIIMIKQLVGSRQFIVIIPTVVLSHLDECKRDSGRARETIRWLESQFQHGNRSLRAQKSQERISLPLIKYPKKKDKEAWNFFQIVECCHYFSKQSEFQSCQSSLLVTLLTGHRDVSFVGDSRKDEYGKEYSPVGVAKNFGINLEHIETFHTKWKLSTKSHG